MLDAEPAPQRATILKVGNQPAIDPCLNPRPDGTHAEFVPLVVAEQSLVFLPHRSGLLCALREQPTAQPDAVNAAVFAGGFALDLALVALGLSGFTEQPKPQPGVEMVVFCGGLLGEFHFRLNLEVGHLHIRNHPDIRRGEEMQLAVDRLESVRPAARRPALGRLAVKQWHPAALGQGGGGWVVAGGVHRDAVQAAAGCDVQHVGFRAGAEAAVGRQRLGRDVGQFSAGGCVNHDAEAARGTHGGVNVSLHVDCHAVDAGLGAEIDEHFLRSQAAVAVKLERIQRHSATRGVVGLGDVKRAAVRRQGQAVGLLDLIRADGSFHGTVRRVVTVNCHLVLFLFFTADVAGVAEVNRPIGQNHEVVWREVASAVESPGEHFQFSAGQNLAQRHEAVVRAAAGDQPPGTVEHQPVALAGGSTVDGGFAGVGIELVNLAGGAFAARDVAEVHRAIGSDRDALGELALIPKFLKPGTRRQNG